MASPDTRRTSPPVRALFDSCSNQSSLCELCLSYRVALPLLTTGLNPQRRTSAFTRRAFVSSGLVKVPEGVGHRHAVVRDCFSSQAKNGDNMNNNNRTWSTCAKCESAVIESFLNPKSRLCKVCDAQRLKDVTYVQLPTSAPELNAIDVDFGTEQELDIDQETGEIKQLTDEGSMEVIDRQMTREETSALRKRAKALEDAADAFLAKAEKNPNIAQDLLRASTDPAQFIMNKVRDAAGIELRDVKAQYTPATKRQVEALKKLGWTDQVVSGKLSVSDASRILQRGPKWLQKA